MPRFSLRDLFWLTLVVALLCAGWVREATRSNQVKYAHGQLHEWPKTLLPPESYLKPGETMEITLVDPGLLIKFRGADGLKAEREFVIEPFECGVSYKPKR